MASVNSDSQVYRRPSMGADTTNEDGTASFNGRQTTETTGIAYIKQCLQDFARWWRDLPGRIQTFFITHCRCCACDPDKTLLIGDTTGNDESDIPSDRRTDNNGTAEVIVDTSEDPSDTVFHDRPDALTDIEPTGTSNTSSVTDLPSPLSLPNPKPEIPSTKGVIRVEEHDFQLEADDAMPEDVIRRRSAALTLPMDHDSLPQNQEWATNKPTGIVRPHQLSVRLSFPSTEGEATINVVNTPAPNTAALTETPKTDDLEDSIDPYRKQELLTDPSLDKRNQDTTHSSMTENHLDGRYPPTEPSNHDTLAIPDYYPEKCNGIDNSTSSSHDEMPIFMDSESRPIDSSSSNSSVDQTPYQPNESCLQEDAQTAWAPGLMHIEEGTTISHLSMDAASIFSTSSIDAQAFNGYRKFTGGVMRSLTLPHEWQKPHLLLRRTVSASDLTLFDSDRDDDYSVCSETDMEAIDRLNDVEEMLEMESTLSGSCTTLSPESLSSRHSSLGATIGAAAMTPPKPEVSYDRNSEAYLHMVRIFVYMLNLTGKIDPKKADKISMSDYEGINPFEKGTTRIKKEYIWKLRRDGQAFSKMSKAATFIRESLQQAQQNLELYNLLKKTKTLQEINAEHPFPRLISDQTDEGMRIIEEERQREVHTTSRERLVAENVPATEDDLNLNRHIVGWLIKDSVEIILLDFIDHLIEESKRLKNEDKVMNRLRGGNFSLEAAKENCILELEFKALEDLMANEKMTEDEVNHAIQRTIELMNQIELFCQKYKTKKLPSKFKEKLRNKTPGQMTLPALRDVLEVFEARKNILLKAQKTATDDVKSSEQSKTKFD
ncbi:hypothetical protein [Kistimonas asteriae]|uniref:hypothetical protein n=1 Tax=Kistimonas asteriae TaxID=517724 RepID=UPI001BA87524|nr:hypothetical protein [Kistimonas asteriae]